MEQCGQLRTRESVWSRRLHAQRGLFCTVALPEAPNGRLGFEHTGLALLVWSPGGSGLVKRRRASVLPNAQGKPPMPNWGSARNQRCFMPLVPRFFLGFMVLPKERSRVITGGN